MATPFAGLGVVVIRERAFFDTTSSPLTRYLKAGGARIATVSLRKPDFFEYQRHDRPFPEPVNKAVDRMLETCNDVVVVGFGWTADIAVKGALLLSEHDSLEPSVDGVIGVNPLLECLLDFEPLVPLIDEVDIDVGTDIGKKRITVPHLPLPILGELKVATLLLFGGYDRDVVMAPKRLRVHTARRAINWQGTSGRPNVRMRHYGEVSDPFLRGLWSWSKLKDPSLRRTLSEYLAWVQNPDLQTAIDPIIGDKRRLSVGPLAQPLS